MNLDIYLQKSSNIFAENRLLKFAIVVLGVAVVINSIGVFQALNSQKVILVPPVINSKISISGDKASDEYIKEFTRYTLGLALTYNPATARPQFSELLVMYDPATFKVARTELYALADKIESTKSASVFYINAMSHDSDKKLIQVDGTKQSYIIGEKSVDEQKTYFVEYAIISGKFILKRLYEKNADKGVTQ